MGDTTAWAAFAFSALMLAAYEARGLWIGRARPLRPHEQTFRTDLVLLILTFLVGVITLETGRTNMMQGAMHRVIFAAFLFLAFVP